MYIHVQNSDDTFTNALTPDNYMDGCFSLS